MSETLENILMVELQAKEFQDAIEKGEMEWEEEHIQFFIPLALHFTNFDWLRLIAKHNLVKEDEIIVTNFLDMVQSLMEINEAQLQEAVKDKINRILGDMEKWQE